MFKTVDEFCSFSAELISAHRSVFYKLRQFTVYIPLSYMSDLLLPPQGYTFQRDVDAWWVNPATEKHLAKRMVAIQFGNTDDRKFFTIAVTFGEDDLCTTWTFPKASTVSLLTKVLGVYQKYIALGNITVQIPHELFAVYRGYYDEPFNALETQRAVSAAMPAGTDLELGVNSKFVILRM